MTKYPLTKSISKVGINYVRTIVESKNYIFHEIHQENDVGIDAIIEFVKNEIPTGKCIALQIKSGLSYFDKKKNDCLIPINGHFNYWGNYALPVIGIVYVPLNKTAYWIDIKQYLDNESHTIRFRASELNKFDINSFEKLFIPYILGQVPELSFEEAMGFFHSKNHDVVYVGLITLFKKYANGSLVWDEFINYFKKNDIENIPSRLIHILSYIPWHSDLYWYKESLTKESGEYAKQLICKFGKKEIIKLLHFIDEENFISRGSIGQCVEAIISMIPQSDDYLKEIILDKDLPLNIREGAIAIYAYHKGKDSLITLKEITEVDSWYIPQIIEFIKENGYFNPYA